MTRGAREGSGGSRAKRRRAGPDNTVFPGEQAARDCNVAAPLGDRGGTLARRSRSREPGLGRVGPSGSEATGWHHYDGARENITERSPREDGRWQVRDACGNRHRGEESILASKKRPGPVQSPS